MTAAAGQQLHRSVNIGNTLDIARRLLQTTM